MAAQCQTFFSTIFSTLTPTITSSSIITLTDPPTYETSISRFYVTSCSTLAEATSTTCRSISTFSIRSITSPGATYSLTSFLTTTSTRVESTVTPTSTSCYTTPTALSGPSSPIVLPPSISSSLTPVPVTPPPSPPPTITSSSSIPSSIPTSTTLPITVPLTTSSSPSSSTTPSITVTTSPISLSSSLTSLNLGNLITTRSLSSSAAIPAPLVQTDTSNTGKTGSNAGAIAGGVVGGLVAAFVISAALYYFFKGKFAAKGSGERSGKATQVDCVEECKGDPEWGPPNDHCHAAGEVDYCNPTSTQAPQQPQPRPQCGPQTSGPQFHSGPQTSTPQPAGNFGPTGGAETGSAQPMDFGVHSGNPQVGLGGDGGHVGTQAPNPINYPVSTQAPVPIDYGSTIIPDGGSVQQMTMGSASGSHHVPPITPFFGRYREDARSDPFTDQVRYYNSQGQQQQQFFYGGGASHNHVAPGQRQYYDRDGDDFYLGGAGRREF